MIADLVNILLFSELLRVSWKYNYNVGKLETPKYFSYITTFLNYSLTETFLNAWRTGMKEGRKKRIRKEESKTKLQVFAVICVGSLLLY